MGRSTTESLSSNVIPCDCFNSFPGPKGHFYATRELFKRGVWIGYLDKSRHSQSYYGLPSFRDLRVNHSKFSIPRPPVTQGVPGEERLAVCRGCAGQNSQLITLTEIKFVGPTVSCRIQSNYSNSTADSCYLETHNSAA